MHEIAFIKSFVDKDKQERLLILVQKNRNKFRSLIPHKIEINKKYASFLDKQEDKEFIYQSLKKYGAPDICHVICENSKYDNIEMNLREGLHELFTVDFGYIISCIPGKLAYYQGEDSYNRAILQITH